MAQETVEVEELVLDATTDKALLVRKSDVAKEDAVDGEDQWWIPKSQIVSTDLDKIGDEGYVEVYGWLATEKGMS